MKAMRLWQQAPAESSPLYLEDIPRPSAGPWQVQLRVMACGVCRTDLHILEGDLHPPALPVILGHQVVGKVEAVGAGVAGLSVGDRVGVPWMYSVCGVCPACRRGEENLCPKARFTGFDVDGGFAELMIAEERTVLALPDNISDLQAAPLLCAGIIGYRSLKQANVAPEERLGLIGFGASAHLTIQIARHWGCEAYVFTRSESHRRHALELGAAWAGGIADTPPHPLDRAILFAPAGTLVPMVLEKLRPGGTLAINAVTMSDIPAMPYQVIYGERTLRSIANATMEDGVDFLKLASEIPLRVDTTEYVLEDANRALQDLKASRLNGEAVLRVADF